MINALLTPGAILGQFYLLSCSLEIHRRGGKKKKKDKRMVERKKNRGRQTEKVGNKRDRLAFFFFDVFAFTTSKFSLIPSVHNRAIDGEKKHFHMCKLASRLP